MITAECVIADKPQEEKKMPGVMPGGNVYFEETGFSLAAFHDLDALRSSRPPCGRRASRTESR